jgi:hypothetical protein
MLLSYNSGVVACLRICCLVMTVFLVPYSSCQAACQNTFLVCWFIDFLPTVDTYVCNYRCKYSSLCNIYICTLCIVCKRYFIYCIFCVYSCLMFVLCSFAVLTCVAVACLRTTPYCAGFVTVLSVCGDYECSMWLVLLFKEGTGVCAADWYGVYIRFQI